MMTKGVYIYIILIWRTTFGVSVIAIDECAEQIHTCDINAACHNQPNGFECSCNEGYVGDGFSCDVTVSRCDQSLDVGDCDSEFTRYHYSTSSGACEVFTYGGCAGNDNNFRTETDCDETCALGEEDRCGDGIQQAGEECDDGNLEDGDGCNYLCQMQQEPCEKCGGECTSQADCKKPKRWLKDLCPSHGANIRCCIDVDKTTCKDNCMGECKSNSKECDGRYIAGLCPKDPKDVKCCIPGIETSCTKCGGSCQNDGKACKGGRYWKLLCPCQPAEIKCCIPAKDPPAKDDSDPCPDRTEAEKDKCDLDKDSEAYKHKKVMEGYDTTGYFPVPESGTTVATGVDLGQQTVKDLCDKGVPKSIIKKLRPYLGLDSLQKVKDAGLHPDDLVLTENEACFLDAPFLTSHLNAIANLDDNLSDKAIAVLVSLRHWSGSLSNTNVCEKLYVKDKKGVKHNYVWEAIQDGKATTKDIIEALKKTAKRHPKGSASRNRIEREIKYLKRNK